MSWKLSCTVWRRGKGRDYFKALPILFYKICYYKYLVVKIKSINIIRFIEYNITERWLCDEEI